MEAVLACILLLFIMVMYHSVEIANLNSKLSKAYNEGFNEGEFIGYSAGSAQCADAEIKIRSEFDKHICQYTKKCKCGIKFGVATMIDKKNTNLKGT